MVIEGEYDVRISALAELDIDRADAWLLAHHPLEARTWLGELRSALETLRRLPERCTRALDVARDRNVRQLQVGRYRALFVVREERREVRVLRVRHLARSPPRRR